jgi:hypothetical protein
LSATASRSAVSNGQPVGLARIRIRIRIRIHSKSKLVPAPVRRF